MPLESRMLRTAYSISFSIRQSPLDVRTLGRLSDSFFLVSETGKQSHGMNSVQLKSEMCRHFAGFLILFHSSCHTRWHPSIDLLPLLVNIYRWTHRQMTSRDERRNKIAGDATKLQNRSHLRTSSLFLSTLNKKRKRKTHKLAIDVVFIGDNFFCRVVGRPSENSYETIINYVRILMWQWCWRRQRQRQQHQQVMLTGSPLFQIRSTRTRAAIFSFILFFLRLCFSQSKRKCKIKLSIECKI